MSHREFSDPFSLGEHDPEFAALFANFAFDEAARQGELDGATRMLAVLAALLGCGGHDCFAALVPTALDAGLTPVQLKEVAYQATAYLGLGRTLPSLRALNEVLLKEGVPLPLPGQSTTAAETRREAGTAAQVAIFGEGMADFWRSGPEESRHINRWLAANCFGDYYTRTGLDLRQRELITFCFLAAQGGCEPQLKSHIAANLRLGTGRHTLIAALSTALPYIGYPRSLNALRCIQEVAAPQK